MVEILKLSFGIILVIIGFNMLKSFKKKFKMEYASIDGIASSVGILIIGVAFIISAIIKIL